MQKWNDAWSQPKNRKVAALLAATGAFTPFVSGFHKFYLGQPVWGTIYLLLSWTPIPHVASGIEAAWYLFQDSDEFDHRFNANPSPWLPLGGPSGSSDASNVSAIANAIRELDQLRADGLLSEYEFEQKRRQLLDQVS
jgi:TM2 domain-containing membrane protein YozV